MTVAAESLEKCRAALGAPSRAAMAWEAMARPDRLWLCRLARLDRPEIAAGEPWDGLADDEHRRLKIAARGAAQWTRRMIEAIG